MLPVIEKFMAAHQLLGITVVADAGMISEANQKAIVAAGLSFILGMKIPDIPYQVAQWRREHPGEDVPDGRIFTQPWPPGPSSECRDQVIYYQYRADRARRTLRGSTSRIHIRHTSRVTVYRAMRAALRLSIYSSSSGQLPRLNGLQSRLMPRSVAWLLRAGSRSYWFRPSSQIPARRAAGGPVARLRRRT